MSVNREPMSKEEMRGIGLRTTGDSDVHAELQLMQGSEKLGPAAAYERYRRLR